MKLRMTYTVDYDVDKLLPEIKDYVGDDELTFEVIKEFVTDRFISPDLLDKSGPHSVKYTIL